MPYLHQFISNYCSTAQNAPIQSIHCPVLGDHQCAVSYNHHLAILFIDIYLNIFPQFPLNSLLPTFSYHHCHPPHLQLTSSSSTHHLNLTLNLQQSSILHHLDSSPLPPCTLDDLRLPGNIITYKLHYPHYYSLRPLRGREKGEE